MLIHPVNPCPVQSLVRRLKDHFWVEQVAVAVAIPFARGKPAHGYLVVETEWLGRGGFVSIASIETTSIRFCTSCIDILTTIFFVGYDERLRFLGRLHMVAFWSRNIVWCSFFFVFLCMTTRIFDSKLLYTSYICSTSTVNTLNLIESISDLHFHQGRWATNCWEGPLARPDAPLVGDKSFLHWRLYTHGSSTNKPCVCC